MAVRITSGPAVVLACGEATTFGGAGLELVLDPPHALTVRLSFTADPEVAGVAVRALPAEPGSWHFELVHFDKPDGRGSAEPVLLGETADGLVFLHFRVSRFGRSADRTVHFTFFRVSKADAGWVPVPAAAR